jgi:hypothetical protein
MVINAKACRSASKRAMTLREFIPGLMIFMATLRRTGCVSIRYRSARFGNLRMPMPRSETPQKTVV